MSNDQRESDQPPRSAHSNSFGFLAGGGLMGEIIRGHDWTSTLGSPHTWSHSLRNAVRFMLSARHPVFLFWGPNHICLYNDAYSRFLGPTRHPAMLGAGGEDMWRDIWTYVKPSLDLAMRGEGAPWHEDECIPLVRDGELQELYWTYSYSPVDDETVPGGVGGAMVVSAETTHKVITMKVQSFRLQLDAALQQADTSHDILKTATHLLGQFLGARRCGFGEVDPQREYLFVRADWTDGKTQSMPDRVHLTEFGSALFNSARDGALIAVEDPMRAQHDALQSTKPNSKEGAGIAVPLFHAERLAAALYIFKGAGLAWNDQHRELIREAALRTFAAIERWRAANDKDQITERLRVSGARYRALVESSAEFVLDLPASGQFTAPQAAWSEYTGQSPQAQLGWGWLDAVHPEDQDRVAEALGSAFDAKADFHLEYRVRHRDEPYHWMRMHAVADIDADGTLRSWVCAHRALSMGEAMPPIASDSRIQDPRRYD